MHIVSNLKAHIFLKSLIESLHEVIGRVKVTANFQPTECSMDASRQILGHYTRFNRFYARLKIKFERLRKQKTDFSLKLMYWPFQPSVQIVSNQRYRPGFRDDQGPFIQIGQKKGYNFTTWSMQRLMQLG